MIILTIIKTWLETTGLKVADTAFRTPPPLPYIVFRTTDNVRGSDTKNNLVDRSITIELYSEKKDETSESLIESLMDVKVYQYSKFSTYINSENFYMTSYDFETTERKGD